MRVSQLGGMIGAFYKIVAAVVGQSYGENQVKVRGGVKPWTMKREHRADDTSSAILKRVQLYVHPSEQMELDSVENSSKLLQWQAYI